MRRIPGIAIIASVFAAMFACMVWDGGLMRALAASAFTIAIAALVALGAWLAIGEKP